MFYISCSDLWIVTQFSWIFTVFSNSEKRCSTSLPFLLTSISFQDSTVFPPAESWLANSNFRRIGCMQGCQGWPVSSKAVLNMASCRRSILYKGIHLNLRQNDDRDEGGFRSTFSYKISTLFTPFFTVWDISIALVNIELVNSEMVKILRENV